MPYTKYKGKSRKYYGPVAKRANVYGPAAMQLAKDVAYLATLVNAEPKSHTVSTSNNYSWSGSIVSLSSVVQGDTGTNRDGNRILPRFLNIRMGVNLATAGFSSAQKYYHTRVIIFRYWGEATSAAGSVTAAEVLTTTGSALAPFSTLAEANLGSKGDRSRRIEVLRNEILYFDNNGGDSGKILEYNIEMNGQNKSKKEHIEFVGSGTAEPCSGGLYMLIIGGHDPASYSTDTAYWLTSRLAFYDN